VSSLITTLHVYVCCLLLQEANQEEMKLLRSGLVTAETQRDQVLLRLQALQAAASASTDPAMKEALTQDTEAAAAAADRPAGDAAAAGADGPGGSNAAPAVGLLAEVGVVQSLRARVAELETELRQVGKMAGLVGTLTFATCP
jgi:hypothetical protein